MKIEDIADLSPGLVITRKKSRYQDEVVYTYKHLNLNAVDDRFGTIDKSLLTEFDSREELEEHYFTKAGDILVRLNEPYTAICITEDLQGILIPSYFIKLSFKDDLINPWYLVWYLNSSQAKKEFLRSQSGTLIPSINQKVIKDLNIPNIDKDKQESIADMYRLHIKEMKLLKDLLRLKSEKFKGISQKLLDK